MLDFTEYYNEEGELMFGYCLTPDPEVKYITPKDWNEYNNQISIHKNIRDRTGLSSMLRTPPRNKFSYENVLLHGLYKKAKSITYETGQLLDLVRSVNNIIPRKVNGKYPAERGGKIFFIPSDSICKVEFFELDSDGDSQNYRAKNPYFRPSGGKGPLAIVHTHPEEALYWRKVGNQAIFDAQYSQPGADGHTLSPLYSVGYTEVDYYSPLGKKHSKNGLCSNDDLLSGRFNLLKHALREYAKTRR